MTEQHNDAADAPIDPVLDEEQSKQTPHEELVASPELTPEQLGEALLKAASTAAYATVGLVGMASDRVKEFYADQKRAYAEEHPDEANEPGAQQVLAQLRGHLERFVAEVGHGIADLAERGRAGSGEPAKEAPADFVSPPGEEAEFVPADEVPGYRQD